MCAGELRKSSSRGRSEFILAITQLAAEKNLPREAVLHAVESALASAYKKELGASHNVAVKANPNTGEIKVYLQKTVVETPADPAREIVLTEAQKIKKDTFVGDTIFQEVSAQQAGRIAAQTAKQVVLQRLREAEREVAFEEYVGREGEVLSAIIQRIEPKQIIVDLGKSEAILPLTEQIATERSRLYRVGQRLKVYVLEVHRAAKGPQVVASRSHRNLLRRLFELEVPEVRSGAVEIKAIAREPGFRSKVAVAARQEGIDPVGSCIGLRGIRIQNIINELNGEKIDVIQWHAAPRLYIANALSPAQVVSVEANETGKSALVVVPDRQLSLAIGKEGQNARLAAKLTGWRIDIKSFSMAEAEKALKPVPEAAPAKIEVPPGKPLPEGVPEVEVRPEMVALLEKEVAPVEEPVPVPTATLELVGAPPAQEAPAEVEVAPVAVPSERPQIRFAEEILKEIMPEAKGKKAQKRIALKPEEPEGKAGAPKAKKGRSKPVVPEKEELEDYL